MPVLSLVAPIHIHKLDPRSKPCVFVGYSPTQSASYSSYCLDFTFSKIYVSGHVKFVEQTFPLAKNPTTQPPSTNPYTWCHFSLPVLTRSMPPTNRNVTNITHSALLSTIPVPPQPAPSSSIITRSKNNNTKPNPKYKAHTLIAIALPNYNSKAKKRMIRTSD